MHERVRQAVVGTAVVLGGAAMLHASGWSREPVWAYGFLTPPGWGDAQPPPQAPPPDRKLRADEDVTEQTRLRNAEGSSKQYSLVDVRDNRHVIDWFPGDHPEMPPIIKNGPAAAPDSIRRGCGSCHLPNGWGRPENGPPGGLPFEYAMRQLRDFRLGLRRSADWRKQNFYTMARLAMAMSEQEMVDASRYFAAIKWTRPWVRVIETDLVPKTRINGGLFIAIEDKLTEPIDGRIIEVPVNADEAELKRNPHSSWIAYVPPGSVERGRTLVTTGGVHLDKGSPVEGHTMACGKCHGPALLGMDDAPPIAGRSPSYLARQIYDIQQGARMGPSAAMMRPVVANLTPEDIVAITAYIGSLPPSAGVAPAAPSFGPRHVLDTARR